MVLGDGLQACIALHSQPCVTVSKHLALLQCSSASWGPQAAADKDVDGVDSHAVMQAHHLARFRLQGLLMLHCLQN